MITRAEARLTNEMILEENLDVRTITMGINLLDCADPDEKKFCQKIYDRITKGRRTSCASATKSRSSSASR